MRKSAKNGPISAVKRPESLACPGKIPDMHTSERTGLPLVLFCELGITNLKYRAATKSDEVAKNNRPGQGHNKNWKLLTEVLNNE